VGNYQGSSQAMESDHQKGLLQEFGNDPRIKAIVHDQDAKLKKTMERVDVEMELMIDQNHLIKSATGSIFDRWNGLVSVPGTSRQVHAISSLEQGLKAWLRHIAYASKYRTLPQRITAWLGAETHYTKEESEWKYKGVEQAKAQLREYLKDVAEKVVPFLQKQFHTNWRVTIDKERIGTRRSTRRPRGRRRSGYRFR
jgi:hypothetical protein